MILKVFLLFSMKSTILSMIKTCQKDIFTHLMILVFYNYYVGLNDYSKLLKDFFTQNILQTCLNYLL